MSVKTMHLIKGTRMARAVAHAEMKPKGSSADGFPSPSRPADMADANVVTSEVGNGLHAPSLDLDVPAVLIPSSTEGHSHLYIDVPMSWRKYKRLLKALGKAGILEKGYVKASIARRATYLRLPWIKK